MDCRPSDAEVVALEVRGLAEQLRRLGILPAVEAVAAIEEIGLEQVRLQRDGAFETRLRLLVAARGIEREALGGMGFRQRRVDGQRPLALLEDLVAR